MSLQYVPTHKKTSNFGNSMQRVKEFREQMVGDECLTDTRRNLLCFQTHLLTLKHNVFYAAPSNTQGIIQDQFAVVSVITSL